MEKMIVAYVSKGLKLQITFRAFAEKIKSGIIRKDISVKQILPTTFSAHNTNFNLQAPRFLYI